MSSGYRNADNEVPAKPLFQSRALGRRPLTRQIKGTDKGALLYLPAHSLRDAAHPSRRAYRCAIAAHTISCNW